MFNHMNGSFLSFNKQVDIICFSHLRWNFVYQRPQHLMSRFGNFHRVFYIEECISDLNEQDAPYFHVEETEGIYTVVPHVNAQTNCNAFLKSQISDFFKSYAIKTYISWYYTAMAMDFTDHLQPVLTVYDCMDELANFKFAPVALKENEALLLKKSDLVFTGGYSLYESKKTKHPTVYPFPSSIDKEHFCKARELTIVEPDDQKGISGPKIGFAGVIDERMDVDMLTEVVKMNPDLQFIMIGPVVKIDPEILPKQSNIHYLGQKSYQQLPAYLSGWTVAMMPFAMNEATQYISPTKTPEYLSAGIPVVSTPIKDVVSMYGENKYISIASTSQEFSDAIRFEFIHRNNIAWLEKIDHVLSVQSWDKTWNHMRRLIDAKLAEKDSGNVKRKKINSTYV